MRDCPQIAVQVVNYRTRRYLERCVDTVVSDLEGSSLAFEINLLENASGEDLGDLAARVAELPGIHSSEEPRLRWRPQLPGRPDGRAIPAHTSIQTSNFCSPTPYGGCFFPSLALRRVKAAGPRLLTVDGQAQPYDHGRLHGLRAEIALKGGHSYWRQTETRQEVAWVSGAAMLVERAAFESIGGFDEQAVPLQGGRGPVPTPAGCGRSGDL